MFLEKQWTDWANTVRDTKNLPLRVELWNGRQLNFGHGTPQVTIRIPQSSSLPYLFAPTISDLGSAYVEGKFELEGDLHSIIAIGTALTPKELKLTSVFTHFCASVISKILHSTQHIKQQDRQDIQYHYDVSNDFYQLWLDKNMVYSCAYFENGDEDLETAQLKKIDHILNKIQLRPGQTLLDIGCGWGALVIRAAQKYGVRCVGITLSDNQEQLARKRVFEAGLNDKVEIRLQDYHDIEGSFDRITSVGMFEHVGLNQLQNYFSKIHALLAEHGMAMNHGITTTNSDLSDTRYGDFARNYVFPGGELPHISTVLKTMQDSQLEAFDVENLRRHYAKTCTMWANNFEAHTDVVKKLAGEKRYRIWRLYLAGSAYAFACDWLSLYQVVCVKSGQDSENLPWSRRYMY